MTKYRKLIAAVVGLAVIIANEFFGVSSLVGVEEMLTNTIVALLTAFGVWKATNDPV